MIGFNSDWQRKIEPQVTRITRMGLLGVESLLKIAQRFNAG